MSVTGYYDSDDLFDRKVSKMVAVLDAWGTPIRAVHPGSLFIRGVDDEEYLDADGTVNLGNEFSECMVEAIYGVAQNRRIYFVSAGPDGLFATGDYDNDGDDDVDDNLYSYPKFED